MFLKISDRWRCKHVGHSLSTDACDLSAAECGVGSVKLELNLQSAHIATESKMWQFSLSEACHRRNS